MNVYATESIRNVVLLGHGGCGKTSLIESMAFTTGIIKRVRTVTEGGTVSDYDKEEVKRKFSIQSSVSSCRDYPDVSYYIFLSFLCSGNSKFRRCFYYIWILYVVWHSIF